MIRDYATRLPLYKAERDALEASFLQEAAKMYGAYRDVGDEERVAPLADFTASCFKRASEATSRWAELVASTPVRHRPPVWFSWAWKRFNREAGYRPS